ncbi:MAG: hypothetical protein [Phage AS32]|nr:MAG: hypothetical protein [Phage AS32]
MSYKGLSDMRRSPSLQERIVACAAQEGIADPDAWTVANSWAIVARSDWIAAWDYAVETYTPDKNPDIGARPDVISDGWILTAVQDVNTP